MWKTEQVVKDHKIQEVYLANFVKDGEKQLIDAGQVGAEADASYLYLVFNTIEGLMLSRIAPVWISKRALEQLHLSGTVSLADGGTIEMVNA